MFAGGVDSRQSCHEPTTADASNALGRIRTLRGSVSCHLSSRGFHPTQLYAKASNFALHNHSPIVRLPQL